MAARAPAYEEGLRVPLWWWLVAAGFVVSVWVAYDAALDPTSAAVAAGVCAVGAVALLVGYGRARVAVTAGHFAAGRARLPLWAVGDVAALDAEQTRLVRGPEADLDAFLVLRGYVPAAVRVRVCDPDDPVPYWLVSTRHPQQLAAALAAARDAQREPGPR